MYTIICDENVFGLADLLCFCIISFCELVIKHEKKDINLFRFSNIQSNRLGYNSHVQPSSYNAMILNDDAIDCNTNISCRMDTIQGLSC